MMKHNHAVATPRPAAASANGDKPAAKPASAAPVAPEDRPAHLSRGELTFYLRNVHRYWSTPRLSDDEMAALTRENLIECRVNGICAIRLTEQGARIKGAR